MRFSRYRIVKMYPGMRFHTCIILLSVFHPVFTRVDLVRPNDEQKNALHETFKNLLNIEKDALFVDQPNTKSAKAASKYMRRLFDAKDLGFDQEKKVIVKAITPKIGNYQDREALIFDFHPITAYESLIKAEIHYFMGTRNKDPQKRIHCFALIPSTDSKSIELPMIPMTDQKNWAVFDAMDILNSTLNSDPETKNPRLPIIFVKGDHLRPHPARKVMRFHAPFMSVFASDPTNFESIDPNDSEEDESDESDQTRKKRDVDNKYYEYYHPYETAYTSSPNDIGYNWKSIKDAITTSSPVFVQRGPSVLRRGLGGSNARSRRKHGRRGVNTRKSRYLNDQYDSTWSHFEQDEMGKTNEKGGKQRRKKHGRILKGDQNPTTVILLDAKQQDEIGTCQRNELVVNFRDIGWGDHVIAPNSFEAHYCAGTCPFPAPATVNASNHAIVLDILQKMNLHPQLPKPCCAPDKLDSLSLLYYDENGHVTLTTYPRMTVVSCACL